MSTDTTGTGGAAPTGGSGAGASTSGGAAADIAKTAGSAALHGGSVKEAGGAAIKAGAQKAVDTGIKKATGSEIAVDAVHGVQKMKNGDMVGGVQEGAASLANAGTTAAVGLTGVGAPVATLAGSLAASLTKSKLGRWAIVGLGLIVAFNMAIVATGVLFAAASLGGIAASLAASTKNITNASVCSEDGEDVTAVEGGSIQEQAWNFLIQAGYTPEQAAGVMGNIKRESQFNPFLAENVTSTPNVNRGWGLVQWTAGRHGQIRDAVLADPGLGSRFYVGAPSYSAMPSGMTQEDVDKMTLFQLNYIIKELNGAEKNAGAKLKASKTVEEATTNFEKYYERAGVVALNERIAAAKGYYEQFVNSTPSSGDTGTTTTTPAPAPTPTPDADTSGKIPSVSGYSPEAMQRASQIVSTTRSLGYSDQAAVLAITTAIGESSLGDNKTAMTKANKDGDAGLYQMRVVERDGAYYGTLEQVQDPVWATTSWLNGVDTHAGHMRGLKDRKGWEGMDPVEVIHWIQRNSAETNYVYSNNYPVAQKIFEAVSGHSPAGSVTASTSQDCNTAGDAGGTGGTGEEITATGDIAAVLQYAQQPVGMDYVFGGGGANGPGMSNLRAEDRGQTGFDCSGLTQYAYFQGMGVKLPRTAEAQWYAVRSNQVPVSSLQPGDLLFYAYGRKGGKVDHIAIYLGNGRMMEASNSAQVVRNTPARTSGRGWVGAARVANVTPAGAASTSGDAK